MTRTNDSHPSASQAGAVDPSGAALGVPGSVEVSCLLMQDFEDVSGVSIAPGRGKVALFANPYREGKEEALIVDADGKLTYLHRADSGTGWAQTPVIRAGSDAYDAIEVVVVVHPGDLSVWAIFNRSSGPNALRLTGAVDDGETSCGWEPVGSPIFWGWNGMGGTGVAHLHVSYDGHWPVVHAVDVKTGTFMGITPVIGRSYRFSGMPCATAIDPATRLDGFAAGRMNSSTGLSKPVGDVLYTLVGQTLARYSTDNATPLPIASDATCLVGVYRSYQRPDIGCVYLSKDGNLVTWNLSDDKRGWTYSFAGGTGLRTATSWADADGMLHVYGLTDTGERGAGPTLKVVRQSSRGALGEPVWAGPPEPAGPACVGLVPDVAHFAVDPFPRARPSQLVMSAGGVASERVALRTLDATGSHWSVDRVRLPGSGDRRPRLVTRYVSAITVLDRRGNPMPGVPVGVSADRVDEIQVDGASHLVGPGFGATLTTNPLGRVAIATAADGLLPPTLHVDVVGLERGAVVQPASGVHEYLAGTGTLPSRQGVFSGTALSEAEVDGRRIVGPEHDQRACDHVAHAIANTFALAAGRPMTSRLSPRTDSVRRIHGFAIGSAGAPGGRVVYTEFDTRDQLLGHHEALRADPRYAGGLDDLADWLGDIWEGIKNGVVQVEHVVVDALTRVYVTIGEAVVDFVVDTVDTAVRVVEAVVAQVVDRVDKVVEWLKTLFDFKAMWETKQALQSALLTILDYTASAAAHFGGELHGWFVEQGPAVRAELDAVRGDYRDPLGDATNQVPALDDASNHAIPARELHDNPQANWVHDQVFTTRALSALGATDVTPDVPSSLKDAWDGFVKKAESSGIGEEAAAILGDLNDLIRRLLDPDDPDQAAKAVVTPLIDVLHRLVPVVLKTADLVQDAVVDLVVAVVDSLPATLFAPLPPGPLGTVYDWVQEAAGVADREEPSLGGLLCLMASCSFTTAYKLVNGVDQVPFPGGEFPTIPPPPWHAGHESSAPTVGDAASNADMKKLKAACGLLTIGGAYANAFSDILPVVDLGGDQESKRAVVSLVAGMNTLFSSTTSAIVNCPGVTGKDWHDWRATGAFLCAAVNATLGWATLVAYRAGWAQVPGFDNTFKVTLGPVMAAGLATGQLVFSACGDAPNGYSRAVSSLSPIPGIFQVVRFGVQKGSEESAVRAAVAAAVDIAVGGAVGLMTAAQSLLPGPDIPQQLVPSGTLHQPYRYAIVRTGERPDNKPLTWTCTGDLPAGLTLDPGTGVVSGTPTATGTSVCTITCTDSYSPPQSASRTGFGFVINP